MNTGTYKTLSSIIILSFISFTSASISAQTSETIQSWSTFKTDVPSPNVAAFTAVNEIPVNLYTGQPNISIPLYRIQTTGKPLAISLSYNASGIKVGQRASTVGLGWSLVVGGVISRSMQSHPDDGYVAGNQGLSMVYQELIDAAWETAHELSEIDWDHTLSCPNGSWDCYDLDDFLLRNFNSAEAFDTKPDIFSFSVGAISGKFILPDNFVTQSEGDAVVLESANIRVKWYKGVNGIEKFEVFETDGTKYTFDLREYVTSKTAKIRMDSNTINSSSWLSDPQAFTKYASAWFLTSIEFARTEEKIEFAYQSHQSETKTAGATMNAKNWDSVVDAIYSSKTQHIHDTYLLTTITTNREKINLSYLDYRSTNFPSTNIYLSELILDKIEIKSVNDDVITNWDFDYWYFRSRNDELSFSGANANPLYFAPRESRLSSVKKYRFSQAENIISPYYFSYYDSTGYELAMNYDIVDRNDSNYNQIWGRYFSNMAFDYWGLYNRNDCGNLQVCAANNNMDGTTPSADEPRFRVPVSDVNTSSGTYTTFPHIFSDRSPNESEAVNGTLASIKYPTGGSQVFTFELHEVSLDNQKITYDEVMINNGNTVDPNVRKPYFISQLYPFLSQTNQRLPLDLVSFSNTKGGGLRIKKIKTYESLHDNDPIIREYKYLETNESTNLLSGRSSGILSRESTESYAYKTIQVVTGSNGQPTLVQSNQGRIQNEMFSPLPFAGDPVVTYREVTEILKSDEGDLRTRHLFTTSSEVPDFFWIAYDLNEQQNSPSAIPNSFELNISRAWARGKEYKTEIYNSSNELISSIEREFDISVKNSQSYIYPALEYRENESKLQCTGSYTNYDGYNCGGYFNTRDFKVEFLTNGYSELVSETHNEYNSQSIPLYSKTDYTFFEAETNVRLLRETRRTNSNDEIIKSTIDYAFEVEFENPLGEGTIKPYTAMKDEFLFGLPFAVSNFNDQDEIQSKTWLSWFNSLNKTNNFWQPKAKMYWRGSSITDVTAEYWPLDATELIISQSYDKYDSFGNLLTTFDADNIATRYYYGSETQPFTQNGLNGINGVYLTGIQIQNGLSLDAISGGIRPTNGDDLFTEAEYDNFGRITKVIDENEQATSYVYDSFNRLVKTENPEGAITRSNYYYSAIADGTFDSTSPNYISSVSGSDGYESDFSSSSDFNSYGDRRFNHYFQGDITLRLGDSSGNWSSVYRSPGAEDVHAKVDVFLSSTYSSGSKPYLLAFNDNNNRFAVRYSYSNDKLEILRRKNGGSYQTVHTFSINASPDKWYTVELEKKAGILMAWVYERVGSRSTGDYYSDAGYPTNWKPQVRMWSDDDYLYFTNFEYTSNPLSSISYLDGLGREIQTQVRAGDKVITSETLYNDRGLPEVVSRPIEESATNIPGFYSNGLLSGGNAFTSGTAMPSTAPVGAYYSANHGGANDNDEFYAYSYTQYEASPLARVEKSTLPGEDHQTNNNLAITTSYGLNTSETFTVNGKTWGVNTLSKTVSRDPDGKETISYTDGWGRTIASGVNMNPNSDDALDDSSDLITKFAYDEQGNLVLVEDPRGLVTTYTYNTLGQLISKKLPDQEYSVNYKYDEAGRLRFTQDPNQQSSKQDLSHSLSGSTSVTKTIVANGEGTLSLDFYVFDLYMNDYEFQIEKVNVGTNTIIYQNSFSPDGGAIGPLFFNVLPGEYKFIGTAVDSGEPIAGSNGTFGFISNDVFTYTKYDNLNRPTEVGEYAGGTTFAAADADNDTFPTTGNSANILYYYDGEQVYSGSLSPQNLKGRLSKVSYRDLSVSSGAMGHTYYSYNTLGLVEWVVQDLPGLSIKKIEYDYDEIGRLTHLSFQGGVSGEQFYQKYSYDKFGRVSKVETSGDGISWTKDAEYTEYAADGQVQQLKLGNSNIQTLDYAYTIQGWLDNINNGAISTGTNGDRFGMSLSYSNNGNITQQQWRQVGTSGTNQNQLSYAYSYDNANRLTAANFSGSGYNSAAFDLEWMNYDKNGNITGYLRRNNNGNIGYDGIGYYGLNYETGTNRISQLVEQVDYMNFDIDHDASGNMIKNQMQGFTSVDYDWRNLPAQMIVGSNTLQYAYDAEGNRVKKELATGVQAHYVRGANGETIAVYEDNVLQFHNILAGSEPIGSWDGSQRRYYLKDHLGSVRTTVDQNGNVDGYDDYYPFGLTMPGRSSNSANPNDDYKFTGYELDDEAGLDIYHANARMMDPVLGRFMQIDPYSGMFPDLSPYNYAFNNPIFYNDPTGKWPECNTKEECLEKYAPGAMIDSREGLFEIGEDGSIITHELYNYDVTTTIYHERPNHYGTVQASGPALLGTACADTCVPGPADILVTGVFLGLVADATFNALTFDAVEVFTTTIVNISDDEIVDDLISGSLKRSPSYDTELGKKTYGELKELARGRGKEAQRAKKMKKLAEQGKRLRSKGNKK